MTLWPHQVVANGLMREHAARRGRGIILQMPTGAGKTKCFTTILAGAYAKGKNAVMVVRGKGLVGQASDRLSRDGIPHGVYQGGNTARQNELILVCSIDTLYRRQVAPPAAVMVIDEVHLSHSDGYKWLLEHENYVNTFKIGVSATPHHKKGMRHVADKIIMPVTTTELIRDGYLVGARYFVPYVPNLKGVKRASGDFAPGSLSEHSEADTELTANAAKVWAAHLRKKSTLVYATGVAHAQILAEALRREGARAELVTAATPDGERAALLAGLAAGEIAALVSVGVLTTGVDIPSLQAIVCCRPTESYNLWIQVCGRGTRAYPGKTHFDLYDLSGNLITHGPFEADMMGSLDGLPEKPPREKMVRCPGCYALFVAGPDECPLCGAEIDNSRTITAGGGRTHGLTENAEVVQYTPEPWELDLPRLIERAKTRGWKKRSLYYDVQHMYGDVAAEQAWARIKRMPQWPVRVRVTTEP